MDVASRIPTSEQVAALIHAQCPEHAGPVRPFGGGWDNVLFRVGHGLLARMPRREVGALALEREARWLPVLSEGLSLPTPVHCFTGQPDGAFPWPWALTPWLAGEPALTVDPSVGPELGEFFRTLHRPAPQGAPREAARSMPLARKSETVRRLATAHPERAGLLEIWEDALAAPGHRGPPCWVHGDLHPFNLLAQSGRLSAVIDWGDLFAGDPAPDLAAAWMLLDPAHHAPLEESVSPGRWRRGRGWAVYFGLVLVDAVSRGGGRGLGQVGARTLRRLCAPTRGHPET